MKTCCTHDATFREDPSVGSSPGFWGEGPGSRGLWPRVFASGRRRRPRGADLGGSVGKCEVWGAVTSCSTRHKSSDGVCPAAAANSASSVSPPSAKQSQKFQGRSGPSRGRGGACRGAHPHRSHRECTQQEPRAAMGTRPPTMGKVARCGTGCARDGLAGQELRQQGDGAPCPDHGRRKNLNGVLFKTKCLEEPKWFICLVFRVWGCGGTPNPISITIRPAEGASGSLTPTCLTRKLPTSTPSFLSGALKPKTPSSFRIWSPRKTQ